MRRLLLVAALICGLVSPAAGQAPRTDTLAFAKKDSVIVWLYGDSARIVRFRSTPLVVLPPVPLPQPLPVSGLVFRSDWATGIGSTDLALTDNGKWPGEIGTYFSQVIQVVSAAAAGLTDAPTPNVLQVNHQTPTPWAGQLAVQGLWPAPKVGESRYWRLYLRNGIANDEGNRGESHHPVETLYGSGWDAWQFNFTTNNDGTFNFFVWTNSGQTGAFKWFPVNGAGVVQRLPKNQFLRFELRATKAALNLYSFEIRVYNPAGVLLYGKASDNPTLGTFKNLIGYPGTANIDVTAAPIPMNDTDINAFEVGTSGGSDLANLLRVEHTWYAAVCVRSDTWCGP